MSNEVLEERIGALSTRVSDMIDLVKGTNRGVEKVLTLEVRHTELHNDVRHLMTEMQATRVEMAAMGQRVTLDMNGLGGRLTAVETLMRPLEGLDRKVFDNSSTIETHKRNFRIIAGFITITFTSALGVMGWLFNRVYDGILEAIHTMPPHP